MTKRTIDPKDRPVLDNLDKLIIGPDDAQFYLWQAQAQRDHGMLSDQELTKIEAVAGLQASKSRVLYNPFTGEIRREFLKK